MPSEGEPRAAREEFAVLSPHLFGIGLLKCGLRLLLRAPPPPSGCPFHLHRVSTLETLAIMEAECF